MFLSSLINKRAIAVRDSKSDAEDTLIIRSGWQDGYYVISENAASKMAAFELVDEREIRETYGDDVASKLKYLSMRIV